MIDKELSELKNDIPNIDIKDFKSGVYKNQALGLLPTPIILIISSLKTL